MRSLKLFSSVVIIMIVLFSFAGQVNASSFNVEINSDKTTIEPGEEIIVTFGVTDVDMGENGINVLEGTLEYDKTIFEEVKEENIRSNGKWQTSYNESTGKFLSMLVDDGAVQNTQIIEISLTAKTKLLNTGLTSNNGVILGILIIGIVATSGVLVYKMKK